MTTGSVSTAPDVDPTQAAAIYVRRSHKDAEDSPHHNRSLSEQEDECRDLAARAGLAVVRIYPEREGTGASRRSRKARPQWDQALADLDDGCDFRTLIVWALDRADRRGAAQVAALLDKHEETGRRILGADGTDTADPQRRLEIIIRAEMAREEAEHIGDRVARTKRYRRQEGRWLGGRPPYGLRVVGGNVEPDPLTFPVARRIADELLAGETLWAVVGRLNAEGIPGPRIPTWRVPTRPGPA